MAEVTQVVAVPAAPAPAPALAEDASAEVAVEVAVEADTDAPSKRAERREKRRAFWEQKKEKKKQQRKEQKQAAGGSAPAKELDMSPEAVLRRRERQVAKRESFLMAAEEGVSVVIDCEFEDLMLDKEKKSLSQQIMFSYGINRRSHAPTKAYITSLRGDTRANLEKISGFDEWLAFKGHEQSYLELFRKESLVYLTADSPHTITELRRDKVYIIGGIVDRNRHKGITYKKAQEQGIATAKLPLDSCVQMGAATRVLTVNHVFQILVQFAESKDWAQAALSTLPSRKGIQSKEE